MDSLAASLLPEIIRERFASWFGADEAERISTARSRTCLRVQTSRVDAEAWVARMRALGVRLEPVPFARGEAWFWDDPEWPKRLPGNVWEHQAGWAYTMDAASLLVTQALDPQPGERVLDLCAAPGGKSAHIADRMKGRGLLVANDASHPRLPGLANNLERLGVTNVALTNRNGAQASWPFAFDRVLVDAPCSNLGHAHERHGSARDHNDAQVERLVALQRDLLAAAFRATRPGGTIVYSTCTLDPRENEANVAWFAGHHAVEIEPFAPPVGRPGLTRVGAETLPPLVEGARRVHPGDAGTDGFFVARFRKHTDAPEVRVGRPRRSRVFGDGDAAWKEARDAWGLQWAPSDARAVMTNKRLFAASGFPIEDALTLDPERIGVAFGVWDMRSWRMTFDAATSFGHGARDAIEVTPDEARAIMDGREVARPGPHTRGEPWRVLHVDGEPIGSSRPMGDVLPSFTPRVRRVPVAPLEHWGRFALDARIKPVENP